MDREERFKCLEIAATILSAQPNLHEIPSKDVSEGLLRTYQIVADVWEHSIRKVRRES